MTAIAMLAALGGVLIALDLFFFGLGSLLRFFGLIS